MSDIIQPNVGTEARFVFKDPVSRYVKSRLNTTQDSILFTTTSVVGIEEMVQHDARNPFEEVYRPIGLTDFQYQEDLKNKVSILSLKYKTLSDEDVYIRVPSSYVQDYDNVADVPYINKVIVIDLGSLPDSLDLSVHFPDLKDFILTRTGVNSDVKEISIGDPENISRADDELRETIRTNLVEVRKTLTIQLAEMTQKYDQILERLSIMGIALG